MTTSATTPSRCLYRPCWSWWHCHKSTAASDFCICRPFRIQHQEPMRFDPNFKATVRCAECKGQMTLDEWVAHDCPARDPEELP